MSLINDPLFEWVFRGTLSFHPSSNDFNNLLVCDLEFATWGPDIVARISLRSMEYQIHIVDEMLLCPASEMRFRSKRTVDAYGGGACIQLQLARDRLEHVTIDGKPHLRVEGDWIERYENKNGKFSMASWRIEGQLKRSDWESSRQNKREIRALFELHKHWRAVSSQLPQLA